jgi:hypothetical protein
MNETINVENDTKRDLYVYKRVEESMPGLVDGIMLLHRGVSRLGFEVKDIENCYYKKVKQLVMKPLFFIRILDIKINNQHSLLGYDPQFLSEKQRTSLCSSSQRRFFFMLLGPLS